MGVEYGLSASGLGGCPSLPAPISELGTAKGSARIQDAQVPKPQACHQACLFACWGTVGTV